MTVKIKNYLSCDKCGRKYGYDIDHYISIDDLRRWARQAGWKKKKEGVRFMDFCKKCGAEK